YPMRRGSNLLYCGASMAASARFLSFFFVLSSWATQASGAGDCLNAGQAILDHVLTRSRVERRLDKLWAQIHSSQGIQRWRLLSEFGKELEQFSRKQMFRQRTPEDDKVFVSAIEKLIYNSRSSLDEVHLRALASDPDYLQSAEFALKARFI